MKIPRFTVRNLLLLIAGLAVGLYVALEFREGTPPRSVLRGIPARIDRLKPGMAREEVRAILGLDRSWLLGGSGAVSKGFHGGGHSLYENYFIPPERLVTVTAKVNGVEQPVRIIRPRASLYLVFTTTHHTDFGDGRDFQGYRLKSASFSMDGKPAYKMPGGR